MASQFKETLRPSFRPLDNPSGRQYAWAPLTGGLRAYVSQVREEGTAPEQVPTVLPRLRMVCSLGHTRRYFKAGDQWFLTCIDEVELPIVHR